MRNSHHTHQSYTSHKPCLHKLHITGDNPDNIVAVTTKRQLSRYSLRKSDLFPLFWAVIYENGKIIWPFVLTSTISVCAYSYYRYDLTVEEAIELGKRAILHATHRDAYSGGTNNGNTDIYSLFVFRISFFLFCIFLYLTVYLVGRSWRISVD